jgi:hypothetical protein
VVEDVVVGQRDAGSGPIEGGQPDGGGVQRGVAGQSPRQRLLGRRAGELVRRGGHVVVLLALGGVV